MNREDVDILMSSLCTMGFALALMVAGMCIVWNKILAFAGFACLAIILSILYDYFTASFYEEQARKRHGIYG